MGEFGGRTLQFLHQGKITAASVAWFVFVSFEMRGEERFREKWPEKIRATGETTLKNREKGRPARKGRRENIISLKLVIIFLDISLCL